MRKFLLKRGDDNRDIVPNLWDVERFVTLLGRVVTRGGGRVKLIQSVSRGEFSFFFCFFVCRDKKKKKTLREGGDCHGGC